MADGYEALDMKCQMIMDDFDEKLPCWYFCQDSSSISSAFDRDMRQWALSYLGMPPSSAHFYHPWKCSHSIAT